MASLTGSPQGPFPRSILDGASGLQDVLRQREAERLNLMAYALVCPEEEASGMFGLTSVVAAMFADAASLTGTKISRGDSEKNAAATVLAHMSSSSPRTKRLFALGLAAYTSKVLHGESNRVFLHELFKNPEAWFPTMREDLEAIKAPAEWLRDWRSASKVNAQVRSSPPPPSKDFATFTAVVERLDTSDVWFKASLHAAAAASETAVFWKSQLYGSAKKASLRDARTKVVLDFLTENVPIASWVSVLQTGLAPNLQENPNMTSFTKEPLDLPTKKTLMQSWYNGASAGRCHAKTETSKTLTHLMLFHPQLAMSQKGWLEVNSRDLETFAVLSLLENFEVSKVRRWMQNRLPGGDGLAHACDMLNLWENPEDIPKILSSPDRTFNNASDQAEVPEVTPEEFDFGTIWSETSL